LLLPVAGTTGGELDPQQMVPPDAVEVFERGFEAVAGGARLGLRGRQVDAERHRRRWLGDGQEGRDLHRHQAGRALAHDGAGKVALGVRRPAEQRQAAAGDQVALVVPGEGAVGHHLERPLVDGEADRLGGRDREHAAPRDGDVGRVGGCDQRSGLRHVVIGGHGDAAGGIGVRAAWRHQRGEIRIGPAIARRRGIGDVVGDDRQPGRIHRQAGDTRIERRRKTHGLPRKNVLDRCLRVSIDPWR